MVNVNPLPKAWRAITPRLRPLAPPIFPDAEPTPKDRRLALALWRELDAESRRWYVRGTHMFAGLKLTKADLALLDEA
jgi:hypothetical protein